MVTSDAPRRPCRSDVAASYDRGVDAYINVWSAVIQPPARMVVAALDLSSTASVIDIGAGTGAMVPSIRAAAPGGVVIAVDASIGMLRAARDQTEAGVVQADAQALPLRNGSADAVLMAFVLFHLSDPHAALLEAARVLRAGATLGTVTWSGESTMGAFTVWDGTLTEAGAPALAPRRVDTGLESRDAMAETLTAAGLHPTKIWLEPLSHQWTPDTYWQMATGSGLNRVRLDALDEDVRAATLGRARQRLEALDPTDFAWAGQVVCAIAAR
jgi:ubiquinone/menaquinone biosynthesis C-methylase UbiE